MTATNFVGNESIVRRIWGNPDTILFIFAGASAEFALNKAVDWLYFTGKLPADPIGRLFSTVEYARKIVFASEFDALKAIDQITAIHRAVEFNRGAQIPDWAYRDVLYMLIDYSIRAFEALVRKMDVHEKTEVFRVFLAVGKRMGIEGLPGSFADWCGDRDEHLQTDLAFSPFTADLYKQYRKHLGPIRYQLLKQVQVLISPKHVIQLLRFQPIRLFTPLLMLYKMLRLAGLDKIVKTIVLPGRYQEQIFALQQKY